MSDRWDDACKAILREARGVTVEVGNHFLGTEHLAVAMLLLPESRLERLLETHGAAPAEVLDLLADAGTLGPLPHGDNIPLTPRLRHIVRRAEELRQAGGADVIGEVHLLGAMLGGGRSVFVRVLEAFELDPDDLLDTLQAELDGRAAPPQNDPYQETRPSRARSLEAVRQRWGSPNDTAASPSDPSIVPESAGGARPAATRTPSPQLPQAERKRPRASGAAPTVPGDAPPPSAEIPAPRLMPMLPLGGHNPALMDWAGGPGSARGNRGGGQGRPGGAPGAKKQSPRDQGILDRIGRDLTDEARGDRLAPIIGRDDELDQLQRALCRANRNSPLLVGDEGVGKSALVAGLAWRVVRGDVPSALRGARIVEIPLAALATDTKYRGDLEERILALVAEARAHNAVLVVDGVEALAATATSRAEAASLLRTALGRAEIRIIGITTPAAYTRDIERDTALSRCFHLIKVAPPDEAATMRILGAARERLEAFHKVCIGDDTLRAAYRLAAEHLKSRHMPDAAIDLLDEACVKAASTPADSVLDDGGGWPEARPETVAAVVSQRTGLPLERLTHDERSRIAGLEDILGAQVIGQRDAVTRVSRRIRMFKAGFREERRPLGVFLFLGPTGVGKTELAKAMASFLFKSEDSLVRLDMSEYAESHQVARLIGPPPGYVGYGEAGQLTEAVRRTPHCVLLLDEIEKAHPRIFDLFLQVFDEGRLTDGRGITTDFTHALIVLTSNIGADLWKSEKRIGFRQQATLSHDTLPSHGEEAADLDHEDEELARRKRIFDALRETFRLEFLNRLDDVILFRPLEPDVLHAIATQMVERWRVRGAARGLGFEVDPSVIDLLCQKGFDPELGARPMKRAVEQYLVAPLSRLVLDDDLPPGTALRAVAKRGRVVFERDG